MRRALKGLGTVLLFLAVAICFAPTIVPPLLDRVYYQGPASDHFDGARFFNPGAPPPRAINPQRFLNRMAGGERVAWPERVPVRPTVPPRRVDGAQMLVTWIGHATVLVQVEGLNILTDPIWSETASPFPPLGPDRVRAPGVRFDDLPKIDLVLISHNHYDHLDLPTLRRLWARDRPAIVTGLGNDAILRGAGIPAIALDWSERIWRESGRWRRDFPPLLECAPRGCPWFEEVRAVRNHHWSSRWFTDRNRALWSAFVVRTASGAIFFAGDTGWGDGSWAREAAALGPYRLAIIPIGAYEPRDVMQANHVNPEEAWRIFELLNPARALGVHWGTFQLTFEAIDDPPRRLAALRRRHRDYRFIAPEVGQTFSVPPASAGSARRAGSGSAAASPSALSRRPPIK